jgi:pectinesterase
MKPRVIRAFALALAVCSTIAGNSKYTRTSPVRGSLVVDASGNSADSHTTISSAVNALQNTTSPQTIFILPGTYTEQVYVPSLAGPLTLQGYTTDARTYQDNTVSRMPRK